MKIYVSDFIIGHSTPVHFVFTDLQKAQEFCTKRVSVLNDTTLTYYISLSETAEEEDGVYKTKKVLRSWSKNELGDIKELH